LENNPYSPPKTVVADPLEVLAPRERTPQVRRMMWLLWMSFGLSLLGVLFAMRELAALPYVGVVIGTIVVVYGIYLLFTIKIGQGRNWARILFLVLFLTGLPFFLVSMKQAVTTDRFAALLGLVQTALQFGAVYYMFFTPAKLWFRKPA
jgi:hypothetical protein